MTALNSYFGAQLQTLVVPLGAFIVGCIFLFFQRNPSE